MAVLIPTSDLHDKLRAYRRNRVREYLVWLTQEQSFRWYVLQEGDYVLIDQPIKF